MGLSLLVIPAELVHEWVQKGEIVKNYYNPRNLFEEVDFLLHEEDQVRVKDLQHLSGAAKVRVFRYRTGSSIWYKTFFWNSRALRHWASSQVSKIPLKDYAVIRCYGADLNLVIGNYIADLIKRPIVVSLHVNYDQSKTSYRNSIATYLRHIIIDILRVRELSKIDEIWPVYSAVIPYLESRGLQDFRIVYNVVNSKISAKDSWERSHPMKIVTVGRLIPEKDPSVIIHAISKIENCDLTIYGDGPSYGKIENLINELGLKERVRQIKSIDNIELCQQIRLSDLMVLYTEYWELSKVMIESILTGLPLVINSNPSEKNLEFMNLPVTLVPATPEAFRRAITDLSLDASLREKIGREFIASSENFLKPNVAEDNHKLAYEEILLRYA